MRKKIGILFLGLLLFLSVSSKLSAGIALDFSNSLIDIRLIPRLYSIDFSPEYCMFVAGGENGLFISYNGIRWQNYALTERKITCTRIIDDQVFVGTAYSKEKPRAWQAGWGNIFGNLRHKLWKKSYDGQILASPVAEMETWNAIPNARYLFNFRLFSTDYLGAMFSGKVSVQDIVQQNDTIFAISLNKNKRKGKIYSSIDRKKSNSKEFKKTDDDEKYYDIEKYKQELFFASSPNNNENDENYNTLFPSKDTITALCSTEKTLYAAGIDAAGKINIYQANLSNSGELLVKQSVHISDSVGTIIDMKTSDDYIFALSDIGHIYYSKKDTGKLWYEADIHGLEKHGINYEMVIVNNMLFIATKYGVYRAGIKHIHNNAKPIGNYIHIASYNSEQEADNAYEAQMPMISVSPNPIINKINININIYKVGVYSLKLTDLTGTSFTLFHDREMLEGEYKSSYQISDLPSGAYNLRIESATMKNHYSIIIANPEMEKR